MTVVLVRSYSLISGSTSDEIDTNAPGAISAMRSRVRRSLAPLSQAWR